MADRHVVRVPNLTVTGTRSEILEQLAGWQRLVADDARAVRDAIELAVALPDDSDPGEGMLL